MADRFPHSTIQCLGAVAQHHRLPVNPERLIEDYALADEEPGPATVLRIAGDIGLKARHDRLSWPQLLAQQGVFPLIARMADGSCVIVVSAKASQDGAPCVAVLNPLADQPTEVLQIAEAPFCQRWKGEVFLLKPETPSAEAGLPFGFRWWMSDFRPLSCNSSRPSSPVTC